MYEDFYGLKERPFTLVPDPDYLFLGSQHKLARAYLEYGIKERMGFVVLTGEVGTGKTTLIKSLLREKEATQRLGVLYQTSVEAEDLLDLLLKEFQVRGHFAAIGRPVSGLLISSCCRRMPGANTSSWWWTRPRTWDPRPWRNCGCYPTCKLIRNRSCR